MKARPLAERFWEKVSITDGCWLWTGSQTKGYGSFAIKRSTPRYAHRLAWEFATGAPVPAGKMVCHRCDVPLCVRIDHLFLGTAADNSADMKAKGRHSHGETSYAKLTEEDVRRIRLLCERGLTQTSVAKIYNISFGQVSRIVLMKNWEHVA